VLRRSLNRGMSVGMFPRQFVLASAMIAAAMFLGGAQARAGYVSILEMAEHDGSSLTHLPASPPADFEVSASTLGSAAASESRPDTDNPQAPSEPVPPAGKLPYMAHNFGQGSGAGNSSSSAPGNGFSTSAAGDVSRPQIPPLELSSLLPPQKGDSHSFSVNSFLFRPPRIS
jgi:hypothetical protein